MNKMKKQHIDYLIEKSHYIYLEWLTRNLNEREKERPGSRMNVYAHTQEYLDECYEYTQTVS